MAAVGSSTILYIGNDRLWGEGPLTSSEMGMSRSALKRSRTWTPLIHDIHKFPFLDRRDRGSKSWSDTRSLFRELLFYKWNFQRKISLFCRYFRASNNNRDQILTSLQTKASGIKLNLINSVHVSAISVDAPLVTAAAIHKAQWVTFGQLWLVIDTRLHFSYNSYIVSFV